MTRLPVARFPALLRAAATGHGQRATLIAAALFCAATRSLAVARTPWDWDELLFCLALRDYDLAEHHPHPPGFPLFIGLAKLVRFVTASDFRALQTIAVIASLLVFPAVYFFARTIGVRFTTAVIAGVLCAHVPTVWFFGGAAFSDVPSLVLVTFAAALLLRNGYWSGTLLLALSMCIRPQNLLIGLIPGLLATRKRKAWEIVAALVLGIAVIATLYGAAMHATGVERFRSAFQAQSDYVLHNDSFLNPERPSLLTLAERFFLKPYGPTHVSIVMSLFVLIALIARRKRALLALATFGPFALFAWLMLDRFQVTRYAIAYTPMLAILAAEGVATVSLWSARLSARPALADDENDGLKARRSSAAEVVLASAIVLFLMLWTIPALTLVRTQSSPALAAIERLRRTHTPSLFVGHSMRAFVDYYLPGRTYERVIDARGLPVRWNGQPWLLADVTSRHEDYGRLWSILRRQYFDVRLVPVRELPQFVDGWNGERVMQTKATTLLPKRTGEQLLRLDLHTPGDAKGTTLTVALNGRILERITLDGRTFLNRDYRVQPSAADVLELTVTPSCDIRLEALSWGPV